MNKLEIPKQKELLDFLEAQYKQYNHYFALSEDLLDPLLIAREYKNEKVALVCALFAYGNVQAMLKFLRTLPFNKLIENKEILPSYFTKPYRFQSADDVFKFFLCLSKVESLEKIFMSGYENGKENKILSGIKSLQSELYGNFSKMGFEISDGLRFLLGKEIDKNVSSPLKRWNLFLRWMVRNDCIDLGLWSGVKKSDLLLPLDTHTLKIAKALGLLKRKSYDFKAVCEVSANLAKLNKDDPIKYDFALYRIGQFKLLSL